jgi:transposase
MAERRTRRRFTAEFKAQAVKRVLDGRSLSEVATELGLSTGQLSTWRTEHLAAGSAEALAQRKAEEAEMQRLRRENKRLEEENLILRKAAAFSPCILGSSMHPCAACVHCATDPPPFPIAPAANPNHCGDGWDSVPVDREGNKLQENKS